MRILGLDFGARTVGVAVSDEMGLIAHGVEVIRRKSPDKLRRTMARIEELAAFYDVQKIILGYPKHMNNSEGDRCEKTKEFMDWLIRRTALPVELWDERLTTVAARRAMDEGGMEKEKQEEYVDEIAAMLILQGYLDRQKNQEKE